MVKKHSWVRFLGFIYILCGVAQIIVLETRCVDRHATFSVAATLLVGLSAILFRAMPGLPTRFMKYLHLFLHLLAMVLLVVGCLIIDDSTRMYTNTHPIAGYVVFGVFLFQFIFAFMLFVYLTGGRNTRLYFAPFHEILGIWIFLCLVGCVLSGNRVDLEDSTDPDELSKDILFIGFAYLGFIILIFILLSPCLDWEMVGNI